MRKYWKVAMSVVVLVAGFILWVLGRIPTADFIEVLLVALAIALLSVRALKGLLTSRFTKNNNQV